ncbi:MAG: adenylate/guanylate cyclase domain-containing protein [Lachnospiraceae bacterium]|nr:adenylate/guanylate cyclase domain-containing protein [Lachnospiraceae bacterium]
MTKKQKLQIALTAFLIAAVTGLLAWARVGYSVDVMVSDALCQRASVANKNIYVIAIDDKTLEQYGSITSWSRALSADLVQLLNQDAQTRPAVIVFDVIFSEKGDAAGDAAFAETCATAGNVVTAMSYRFKEQPEYDKNGKMTLNQYHIDGVIMPYEALREATNQGYANTLVGADGYVRRAMAYIDDEQGQRNYSLASQAYKMYQESRGENVQWPVLDENNQYLFSYSGKTGCYSTISMTDVMDGTVNPAIFADGIVFVGAYAVGMQDSYIPAISHGTQMYGVEIQANIVEALLEGKTQQQLPSGIYAVLAAVLAAAFYLAVRRMKIIPATVLMVVCIVVLGPVFAVVMYARGYVTPVILLPVIFFLIYAVNLVYGYVQEVMRRQKVVNVFKQYVAPQVVDKISKDKDFELVLGGENRHIACLFVDIRGFTTMSESLKPEEVVEILNEYLNLTTNSIFQNGGTLDKFVGDATMAVFNAPFDLEDYIYKAVCTARDMKAGADAIAEKFEKRFGKSVGFGIGVNCGNAVVGNIGCEFRMDYTAIGDTVNTAARLESNAKRGQILISKEVYEAVKDRVEVTPVGEIPLKGKTQGVFVYQLDEVK